MTRFTYKQGDTAPPLEYQLTDEDGDVLDLTDADNVSLFGVTTGASTNSSDLYEKARIVDASDGQVAVDLDTNQTDIATGTYNAEFVVHWADGDKQTVPASGYLTIEITTPAHR